MNDFDEEKIVGDMVSRAGHDVAPPPALLARTLDTIKIAPRRSLWAWFAVPAMALAVAVFVVIAARDALPPAAAQAFDRDAILQEARSAEKASAVAGDYLNQEDIPDEIDTDLLTF